MTILIGSRFQEFTETGSMGVVNDTTFWRCYWPALEQPTALFAKGSSGLKVMGSSRNIVWPDDTEFLDYYPDALYPAELAVQAEYPGQQMVELMPEQVDIYMKAYDEAVASFPPTHSIHSTVNDCYFLVHKELASAVMMKPTYDLYVAEVDVDTAKSIASGKADVEELKAEAEFISISDTKDDPETQVYSIDPVAGLQEVTVDATPEGKV